MEILIPGDRTPAAEREEKVCAMKDLEPLVADLYGKHKDKRKLWFPNDFLPADEQSEEADDGQFAALKDRARGIPDAVRVAIAVSLITEEGLPHFHRLLATYLGDESVWSQWNYLWTAEEDRHGCVIRDYVRDARLFKFREVEIMQHAYLEAGFSPDWDKDPYKIFVYTSLQERATQMTHANTGKAAGKYEPLLQGILTSIAADEARHYSFYRDVVKALLERDVNRMLTSALAILPNIEMPGFTMPHFKEMTDVIRRVGIYGPWEYKEIVETLISYWGIEGLCGLNEAGRIAQQKIGEIGSRIARVAEYLERRSTSKTFSFGFLYHRLLAMG